MRDKIRLVSTAGTGYFYTTTKNKRTMPEKMEIKKFDPKIRQHVIFKEAKNKRTMPEKMEIKKFDPKIRQHVIFKEAKIK